MCHMVVTMPDSQDTVSTRSTDQSCAGSQAGRWASLNLNSAVFKIGQYKHMYYFPPKIQILELRSYLDGCTLKKELPL